MDISTGMRSSDTASDVRAAEREELLDTGCSGQVTKQAESRAGGRVESDEQ